MAGTKLLNKFEVLIKEGEISQNMYLLQSGQLVVTKKRGKTDVQLGFIDAGELVGEMSFLDGEPRSATVRAVTDCELIEIPHEVLENVLNTQPAWFRTLLKTLTERLRKANSKIKI
jgi:CRP/FNR family transcriptional regulator, cyclic AMP receptor protein